MTRHRLSAIPLLRVATAAIAASLFLVADAPAAPPPAHAAGIVVNTLADANPPVIDGQCSLREAILNANANAAVSPDCAAGTGADTITFSVSGTINLATQLHPVTSPAGLTIDGTARNIKLRGGGFGSQFHVSAGAVAEVRGLTFELNPVGLDPDREGGGINNAGILTLNNVTVRDNVAKFGGGVYSTGTLIIQSGIISGNKGGGVHSAGTVVLQQSTLSGNQGTGLTNTGTGAVANSTISGNGAISLPSGMTSAITGVPVPTACCTSAFPDAGGVRNYAGSLVFVSSTITTNSSYNDPCTLCGPNYPGGITNSNSAALALINSIVAKNYVAGVGDWDCGRTNSDFNSNIELIGPNLIGTLFRCGTFGSTPIVGDPLLGPLADNGGPTLTHAPHQTSLAIDAGDDARCAAAPVSGVDQRGVSRTQGAHCDLGAVAVPLGRRRSQCAWRPPLLLPSPSTSPPPTVPPRPPATTPR